MPAALAAPNLPARFCAAIDLLCRGLANSLPQNWGNAALALSAWTRLRRLLARFTALVAAVEAGRLPVPRRAAASSSRPRPAAGATRLPGRSGWLLTLAPALETRVGRSQVESLLADPALVTLLAQAPQAGRILRPLCHMLRIELPPALRLKPRRPHVLGSGVLADPGSAPGQMERPCRKAAKRFNSEPLRPGAAIASRPAGSAAFGPRPLEPTAPARSHPTVSRRRERRARPP